MALGNRVKEARLLRGIGQVDLAKCAGVGQTAISALEQRDSETSKFTQQIAKCLGVNPDWLATGKGEPDYNNAFMVQQVPLISWVHAGEWSEANDPYVVGDAETWIPYAVTTRKDNNVTGSDRMFALRVSGVSMEPTFNEGDIIIVDPDQNPSHGSFVVVRLDDDNVATFKQLIIEHDKRYLKALNPIWVPQLQPINGNATLVGVVVSRQTSY